MIFHLHYVVLKFVFSLFFLIKHISIQDMKLPDGILQALKEKKISRPTPIQMQGIPTVYVKKAKMYF